jgi:hypothetical protein
MSVGKSRRRRDILPGERGRNLLAIEILRGSQSVNEQDCGEHLQETTFHAHLLRIIIVQMIEGVY